MSFLNPEYKFECEKCGNVWYMSSKDIKEAKKNTAMIKQLNMKQKTAILAGTKRKIEAQKSVLENKGVAPDKCPSCGSRSIKKSKE